MDQLIENAIRGQYNGKPAKYSALYKDLAGYGLSAHVIRLQTALHNGKLLEELIAIAEEKEAMRP